MVEHEKRRFNDIEVTLNYCKFAKANIVEISAGADTVTVHSNELYGLITLLQAVDRSNLRSNL